MTHVVLSAVALLTGSWDTAQQLRADTHREAAAGADCYDIALDYRKRLRRAGIESRVVIVQATMLNDYDSHSFVEVKKNGRWVIQDPTFDGGWRLNGRLVGTREIQAAWRTGTWQRVRWVGPQTQIRGYYVDPRLLMRHARFRQWDPAGAMTEVRSDVPRLHALYYAQPKRPPGSIAALIVSDTPGSFNGYKLEQLPDSRWITPVMLLPDRVPDGSRVMWVRRYH